MDEKEKIETLDLSEIKIEDLSNELKDFPHIIDYIQKLKSQLKLQGSYILKLKKKLIKFKKKRKLLEKSYNDSETQTDCLETEYGKDTLSEGWLREKAINSMKEQVTKVAETAMLQTGFVYEEITGLYYDSNTGYYYDAQLGLYYNGNTGTYYSYDAESNSYQFHSQVHGVPNDFIHKSPKIKKRRFKGVNNKEKKKKVKPTSGDPVNESIGAKDDNKDDNYFNSDQESNNSTSSSDSENDAEENYPPCIRIIVQETYLPTLKLGTLFIITCTGGSVGREGDHLVLIPDINISKHHAKFQYNNIKQLYEIIDLGSRNGTLLNGKRLSPAKQESEPMEIQHGSILQLGSTKLLCHIHSGYETCGHCEPGLFDSGSIAEKNITHTKTQYQSELKRLKDKFGLVQNNICNQLSLDYQDRAQSRRENVGSSSEYEKTQQSSLSESIPKNNIGFKMLSKMGWAEGKPLGKNDCGLTEPLSSIPSTSKAGLGMDDNYTQADENDKSVQKKQKIWRKTQKRYNDIND